MEGDYLLRWNQDPKDPSSISRPRVKMGRGLAFGHAVDRNLSRLDVSSLIFPSQVETGLVVPF
jgi:hypothetical protein